MPLVWHGDEVMAGMVKLARQKVVESCILLQNLVKMSMKKGGRTESGELESVGYVTKTGGLRQKRVEPGTGRKAEKIGTYVSKPGEVPRVQFARLKGSIEWEIHPVLPVGRVGTNLPYGKFLELGTRRMAPRPFMRPAIHRAEVLILGLFSRVKTGEL